MDRLSITSSACACSVGGTVTRAPWQYWGRTASENVCKHPTLLEAIGVLAAAPRQTRDNIKRVATTASPGHRNSHPFPPPDMACSCFRGADSFPSCAAEVNATE